VKYVWTRCYYHEYYCELVYEWTGWLPQQLGSVQDRPALLGLQQEYRGYQHCHESCCGSEGGDAAEGFPLQEESRLGNPPERTPFQQLPLWKSAYWTGGPSSEPFLTHVSNLSSL
jgi:hypothetical protein